MAQVNLAQMKKLPRGIVTVPNVAANYTTKDTILFQIAVANKTAGVVTLTVLDRQGSPKTIVPTISIDPNAMAIMSWPEGLQATGGVNIVASAANAIDAEIFGFTTQ